MKVRIKTEYVIDWPGEHPPTLRGEDGIFTFLIDGLKTIKPQAGDGDVYINPGAKVQISLTREAANEARRKARAK